MLGAIRDSSRFIGQEYCFLDVDSLGSKKFRNILMGPFLIFFGSASCIIHLSHLLFHILSIFKGVAEWFCSTNFLFKLISRKNVLIIILWVILGILRARVHHADAREGRGWRRRRQRQRRADGVGDGFLLALVHEAGGEEVLDVEESSVLIGEVGGEPGDVPVLVDDQASAQQTPHRHAHEVLVVTFHLGGLHSVGDKI